MNSKTEVLVLYVLGLALGCAIGWQLHRMYARDKNGLSFDEAYMLAQWRSYKRFKAGVKTEYDAA